MQRSTTPNTTFFDALADSLTDLYTTDFNYLVKVATGEKKDLVDILFPPKAKSTDPDSPLLKAFFDLGFICEIVGRIQIIFGTSSIENRPSHLLALRNNLRSTIEVALKKKPIWDSIKLMLNEFKLKENNLLDAIAKAITNKVCSSIRGDLEKSEFDELIMVFNLDFGLTLHQINDELTRSRNNSPVSSLPSSPRSNSEPNTNSDRRRSGKFGSFISNITHHLVKSSTTEQIALPKEETTPRSVPASPRARKSSFPLLFTSISHLKKAEEEVTSPKEPTSARSRSLVSHNLGGKN